MLDEQAHFPESEIGGVQPSDSVRRAVPDLVIGDFNIPRGSASFDAIFPAMQYAFNQAGHGYGASYNRTWLLPLYHIDHILIGRGFKATRYDLIDPGVGRHLAQVAWIVPSDNE
jgi:endonuclease/exonuclease/phosphatase family metal-dependent hydrolase